MQNMHIMRTRLLFMALMAMPIWAKTQDVVVNEATPIGAIMQAWISDNRANLRVVGWRAQVLSSTDRQQIESARTRFRLENPNIPAEWIHEKPYYKLRVGAFRTKVEALAFISTIRDLYPDAFPAQDQAIHPRDFLK